MPKLVCQYCEVFFRSPVVNKNGGRNCAIRNTSKIIESDSEACRKFRPANIIACSKSDTFVLTEVCLSRHKNGYKIGKYFNCKKCIQFRRIKKAMENWEPPERQLLPEDEMDNFKPSEMSMVRTITREIIKKPTSITRPRRESKTITRSRKKSKIVKDESGQRVLIRKRRRK